MSLDLDGEVSLPGFELAVQLHVAPGEVLALLGPNGAGKTTVLRTVAGLVALSRGSLRVDGRLLDDGQAAFVPAHQRRVAVVFQDYRLFPHLDVTDNVAFAARVGGAGRRRSRSLAQPWLERFDLSGLATRSVAELSGGQAQRVALARALAAEPAVLLLDEPLAALDVHTRLMVRAELATRLRAKLAVPVVLVTHDPLDAMVLADRLLVMEDGRAVQQGPPADVARRPATPYVARLMGLNLYAGALAAGAPLVSLDGGGELAVTAVEGEDLGTGRQRPTRVHVALRPAAVTVHVEPPRPASTRNVWRGTVTSVELLGDRARIAVTGAPDVLADVTPAAVAQLRLGPGRQVWVSAKATETTAYPSA